MTATLNCHCEPKAQQSRGLKVGRCATTFLYWLDRHATLAMTSVGFVCVYLRASATN